MSNLKALVAEAFRNAAINGERFEVWTFESIAVDMLDKDCDIASYPLDAVIAAVIEVLGERGDGNR